MKKMPKLKRIVENLSQERANDFICDLVNELFEHVNRLERDIEYLEERMNYAKLPPIRKKL